MSKRKKPAVEAFDKEGPTTLQEGYTWCPECQASYQGEVCPGCVDLSGAGAAPPPEEAEGCGPCSVCQTETTYSGEHNGDYPVWLCPDHGGERPKIPTGEEGDPGAGPSTLAEAAAALPDVETTTITEILPVALTDAEHKEISIKMAAANQEIAKIKDEKASIKSQYKSREDAAVAIRNDCAAIINAGHQQKPVECTLFKDFRINEVSLIRSDTGELVRTRTMTGGERQRGLFPGGAPAAEGAKEE